MGMPHSTQRGRARLRRYASAASEQSLQQGHRPPSPFVDTFDDESPVPGCPNLANNLRRHHDGRRLPAPGPRPSGNGRDVHLQHGPLSGRRNDLCNTGRPSKGWAMVVLPPNEQARVMRGAPGRARAGRGRVGPWRGNAHHTLRGAPVAEKRRTAAPRLAPARRVTSLTPDATESPLRRPPSVARAHARDRHGRRHDRRRVDLRPAVGDQRQLPSVSRHLLAWIAAGPLTLAGALRVRGAVVGVSADRRRLRVSREAFSPASGFLWGWAMFWSMHSGIIAAIAMVFARYLALFVPLNDLTRRRGSRRSSLISCCRRSTTPAFGTAASCRTSSPARSPRDRRRSSPRVCCSARHAAGRVARSLDGRQLRGFVLAHRRGPLRVRRLAHGDLHGRGDARRRRGRFRARSLIGTLVVTACYAGLNAIYLRVLPLDAVRASSHIAADAAAALVRRRRRDARRRPGARLDVRRGQRHHPRRARASTTRWRATACCSAGSAQSIRVRTPHLAIVVQAVVVVGAGAHRTPTARSSRASSTRNGFSSRAMALGPDRGCAAARTTGRRIASWGIRSCRSLFIAAAARHRRRIQIAANAPRDSASSGSRSRLFRRTDRCTELLWTRSTR